MTKPTSACAARSILAALVVAAAGLHAAPADAGDMISELDLFELEEAVREQVTTITKTKQDLREAPSVVTVVSREEIRTRGWRSVAEILAATAGFHVIDDLVLPDAGVRGVHGGVNGASRLVKVMIDGTSVDFRPTTGTALGPELIPIELVERVEIIRGPVSALYGADAFLAVVNVITRSGAELDSFHVGLRSGAMHTRGRLRGLGGLSLFGGTRAGDLETIVGASFDVQDRSGLPLPSSSPDLGRYGDDPSSAGDTRAPRSFYGRIAVDAGRRGTFRLSAGAQRTDANQEFVDTAVEPGRDLALTHGTRVDLENQHAKLEWMKTVRKVQLLASAAYATGQVGGDDVIDVGDPLLDRRRELGYQAIDLATEARYQPNRAFALVGGLDFSADFETPQRTYSVYNQPTGPFRAGDVRLLQQPPPDRTFTNLGLFGQVIHYPLATLGLTAGVRLDEHSLYGLVPNGRVGVVYLPGPSGYVKALLGTSFKAPSDDQLYSQPIYEGALAGNDQLAEQRATTGELVVGHDAIGRHGLSLAAFYTRIDRKVEFLPTGAALRAENIGGLQSVGLEAEGKLTRRGVAGAYDVSTWANLSLVRSVKESGSVVATTDAEPYPGVLGNLGLDVARPRAKVRAGAHLHFVGSSPATGSNVLIAERLGMTAYRLDPYALLNLAVSSVGWKPFGRKELVLGARATNLFDVRYAHPGTGGVDIPGLGRTFFLSLQQEM